MSTGADDHTRTMSDSTAARSPLGSVERVGDDLFELRFVRDYPHPVETVWRSLTDPAQTSLWWAESRIDLRVGGSLDLRWLNGEDGAPQEWTRGEILSLDEGRSIEFTNSVHGMLRWELEPTPDGTRLTLVNRVSPGEERFVPMSLGGWHMHLDHLAAVLEGGRIDWPRWYPEHFGDWEVLRDEYRRVTGVG
jgi:uncharacterized protein YndB with AHSA1/START domain